MRRLRPVVQSGGEFYERRRNRRIAYFRGKYARETIMALLIFCALFYFLIKF